MILNYAASPFIILSAKDCIETWKLLGWYGHIVVMGSLLFFYAGGAAFLKGLQKTMGVAPPPRPTANGKTNGKVNGTASGTASGTETPVSEKNVVLPPSVDKIVPPPL